MQDLHVSDTLPQMVALSEAYLQVPSLPGRSHSWLALPALTTGAPQVYERRDAVK